MDRPEFDPNEVSWVLTFAGIVVGVVLTLGAVIVAIRVWGWP